MKHLSGSNPYKYNFTDKLMLLSVGAFHWLENSFFLKMAVKTWFRTTMKC